MLLLRELRGFFRIVSTRCLYPKALGRNGKEKKYLTQFRIHSLFVTAGEEGLDKVIASYIDVLPFFSDFPSSFFLHTSYL